MVAEVSREGSNGGDEDLKRSGRWATATARSSKTPLAATLCCLTKVCMRRRRIEASTGKLERRACALARWS
jgi:hypothetical protein